MWFWFISIQIFSLVHRYHFSTTTAPILSGPYFNTPAVLFNTSELVAILWLAATLARINKKKWSLKKNRKNQAKLNAIAKDFSFKKFLCIQGSPALCQPFYPNKPDTQTFLTLQSKWTLKEELCLHNNSAFRGRNSTKFWTVWIIVNRMSGVFIHITNFKITMTNLNSKFYIYYHKFWYFLNIWVSNFLEERSSTVCASSSYNFRMKNWNQ